MTSTAREQLLRATVFHTPRNPFLTQGALEAHADGGLVIAGGRIAACGDYAAMHSQYPQAAVRDLRGGFLLPGLVDTHIHYPQVRILGSLGRSLLQWLEEQALPEEARLANEDYARNVAAEFVHNLATHGTTTALVFGAHFQAATAALFETAARSGLRIGSGLVVSDRRLRPELHQTPEAAYRASREGRWGSAGASHCANQQSEQDNKRQQYSTTASGRELRHGPLPGKSSGSGSIGPAFGSKRCSG